MIRTFMYPGAIASASPIGSRFCLGCVGLFAWCQALGRLRAVQPGGLDGCRGGGYRQQRMAVGRAIEPGLNQDGLIV
jgi:hypothetical protein